VTRFQTLLRAPSAPENHYKSGALNSSNVYTALKKQWWKQRTNSTNSRTQTTAL